MNKNKPEIYQLFTIRYIILSVNLIAITRKDWQQVAKDANTPFVEIELVCSDSKEHQRRIETRQADIPGHKLPNWTEVLNRDYEPWKSKTISLDTSEYSIDDSVKILMDLIRSNYNEGQ